jgi:hypothetical protein
VQLPVTAAHTGVGAGVDAGVGTFFMQSTIHPSFPDAPLIDTPEKPES